jgi:dTDP-4-amino-4,6-dideoxygalactose transaminase
MHHDSGSAVHIYTVRASRGRDFLFKYLTDRGILVSMHYPPTHRMSYYKNLVQASLPMTEQLAEQMITLPLFYEMPVDYVDHVLGIYAEAITAYKLHSRNEPVRTQVPLEYEQLELPFHEAPKDDKQ